MVMRRAILSLLVLLVPAFAALAGGPITWSFEAVAAADGKVEVHLKVTCEEGWHIYALTLPRDDGPIPTAVRVNPSAEHVAGAVVEPKPEEAYDPNFGMDLRFHERTAVFVVPVERLAKGGFTGSGEVEYMACNEKTCLPPVAVPFSVTVPAP
jgi:thiol:disulfide interchange protein DsbD